MKKILFKRKIGAITMVVVVCAAITAIPVISYAADYFKGVTVTTTSTHTSGAFYVTAGHYAPFVSINKVASAGTCYLTFPQLRADGTYGGGAGVVRKIGMISTGQSFGVDLGTNYHKLKISGGSGLNMTINYVRAPF